jgi:hypothetical protein
MHPYRVQISVDIAQCSYPVNSHVHITCQDHTSQERKQIPHLADRGMIASGEHTILQQGLDTAKMCNNTILVAINLICPVCQQTVGQVVPN